LFLSPKNEELEGFYVFQFQWVPVVAVVGVVLVLGGLDVRVMSVVEIMVLVLRQQQQMFSLGSV
jgi:hypothetical protein